MRAEASVVQRDSSRMSHLATGSAHLVLTGPPYFDKEAEALLRKPVGKQHDIDRLEDRILSFARRLSPVFAEVARILRPTGHLIMQTKDIRYGDRLIPLAHEHECIARNYGFRVVTRVYWDAADRPRRSNIMFAKRPRRNGFRARELETFSVFGRAPGARGQELPDLTGAPWLEEAVWRVPGDTYAMRHPHAAPPEVLRRLLLLYSRPGDLIVDPFCGGGGILLAARNLGRSAIGYEIDPVRARNARSRLAEEA